jgi:iron complex transport system substrate-binding protein
MRIVSLLPSATEVLFALGFDREIVGVSHECDFPARAKTKKTVIRSRLPHDASPEEIDRLVREYVDRGESLYAVDADVLEELAPDLIVTQDLCHVCAASPDDLATALARFQHRPEVLCLNPQDLGDVWRDVLWMGEETLRAPRAQELLEKVGTRLGELQQQVESQETRPRVVLLEWLQPYYVGGHWVPEMIQFSGGLDVLGKPGSPSRRVTMQEVIEAKPDVLLIAPCGYRKELAAAEYLSLEFPEQWHSLPAVRAGRVYALDANSYVSRPSLRLVTGIAAMAKAIHPATNCRPEVLSTLMQIAESGRNFQAASA